MKRLEGDSTLFCDVRISQVSTSEAEPEQRLHTGIELASAVLGMAEGVQSQQGRLLGNKLESHRQDLQVLIHRGPLGVGLELGPGRWGRRYPAAHAGGLAGSGRS